MKKDVRIPTDTDLVGLRLAVELLMAAEDAVAIAEKALEEAKAEAQRLSTQDVPDAMTQCGFTKFTTEAGSDVTVAPYLSATTKHHPEECYTWLEKHKLGSIIKRRVIADFGKDEEKEAERARKAIVKLGLPVSTDLSVHYQTLVATLKKELERGTRIPKRIFALEVGQKARVKR